MRRYGYDFDLRSTSYQHRGESRGRLDPNYRGGQYQGERMQAEREGQATYGQYRFRHRYDLGGFRGVYGTGRTRFLGGPAGHENGRGIYSGELENGYGGYRGGFSSNDRGSGGYSRDYAPRQSARSGYDQAYRGQSGGGQNYPRGQGSSHNRGNSFDQTGRASQRDRSLDASRALRYDNGFNTYGGYNTGGFGDNR